MHCRSAPSNDELKTAYRKRLLEVHPDKNPKDPLATEKTRAVISAFELLTSGKFRDENMRFHNRIQVGFTAGALPAFIEEITATHIIDNTGDMYIGCYSGKFHLVRKSGTLISTLHDCKSPILAIKEVGQYLYLVSDGFFDVLLDGKYISRFTLANRFGRLVWGSDSGMEITSRRIRLFDLRGSLLAQLESRDNIADAYLADDRLKVITAKKIYQFSVKSSTGYEYLGEKSWPTGSINGAAQR